MLAYSSMNKKLSFYIPLHHTKYAVMVKMKRTAFSEEKNVENRFQDLCRKSMKSRMPSNHYFIARKVISIEVTLRGLPFLFKQLPVLCNLISCQKIITVCNIKVTLLQK